MGDLFKEMFRARRYKSNQGRLVRRLTLLGVVAAFLSGAYKFYNLGFVDVPFLSELGVRGVAAGVICALGGWFAFRLVNWPTFADFLISVEAEMVKVSWPSKAELYSSTVVVLVMFAILAVMIFAFDMVWLNFFRFIKIMS